MTTGNAVAGVRARSRSRSVLPLIITGLGVLLLAAPFALNLAGDAQVHLAIAENFAHGRPFQYNPNGEIVVASTSPFWTLMLTLFFRLAGSWTPALLSAVALIMWLASGYVLYRLAHEQWRLHGLALWAVVLLWFGHATIVANALGGLENVAAALQLLLLAFLLGRYGVPPLTVGRSAMLGLVLGWALLTRPDGGLFALMLMVLGLPVLWFAAEGRRGYFVVRLLVIGLVTAMVVVPWFAYQYTVTGRLLTDSSMARLYNGRLGSLMIIRDLLYFHPKPFVSLVTAFLPLVAGFLITAADLGQRFRRAKGQRAVIYRALFPRTAAVVLVAAGFLFYTFIVGAEAFGRYFLPLFPFLFLAGVAGLALVYERLRGRGWTKTAIALAALAALFLVGTSALDAYRRLGPGRFVPERALDVIYGPANRRYYAPNMPWLVGIPARRAALTDEFLRDLNAKDAAHHSIAVTEVQLRYFLDDRVTVLSLDGRTSADILDYVDPVTGVPDFARYFLAARPEYVHANQWCAVGGWLAGIVPASIDDNLVCAWERRAAAMQPGESFSWQGRSVTLVAPEILHIEWGGQGEK